jgi:hypothetical protein
MPRTTVAAACRERGIKRGDWEEAKRQGVDPWDREAMDFWLGGRRHRIKNGATMEGGDAVEAQSLEEIEDALRKARDIDTVKILKEKLLGLKAVVQVRQETKELVSVSEVREEIVRCVSATRAEIMKLSSDLPPRLAGLDEKDIQQILVSEIRRILLNLSEETGVLFEFDTGENK